jgi:hypothetical protein
MSNGTVRSSFDGVKIDGDGNFVCKCGFPMRDYRVKKKASPYYGQQCEPPCFLSFCPSSYEQSTKQTTPQNTAAIRSNAMSGSGLTRRTA